MQLRMAATALVPLVLLAGCGDAPSTEPAQDTATQEAVEAVAERLPEPEQPAEPMAQQAIAIPAAYLGVWDYEGGTCAPESDMRMEVTATDITYYESYGQVTGTRPDGDDLIVDLAMEGEGDQWSESQRLSLVGSGTARRLHVTNGEQPKTDDDYPRKSCG